MIPDVVDVIEQLVDVNADVTPVLGLLHPAAPPGGRNPTLGPRLPARAQRYHVTVGKATGRCCHPRVNFFLNPKPTPKPLKIQALVDP